jgi:PKD repeat protein
MEKKFYSLILFILFSGLLSARAQDTTRCNPRFGVGVSGRHATFQAIDTLRSIRHYWNFGDSTHAGFSRNLRTVHHTYRHPGTYTVTHIIKDSLGGACFDSSTQSVSVDLPPTCQISFQAMRDTVNHHFYNFFASYTISGGHDSIFWLVNDSLVGTGPTLLNHFFSNGIYTVCAKLTTSTGCQAEQCGQISVGTDSTGNGNPDSCGIHPSFGYAADSSNSQRIHFIPTPDSIAYSYLWDFGDGISTVDREPYHTYSSGGTYTVTLSVTKHSGLDSCRSTATGTVFVAGVPKDSCKISFTYTRDPSMPNKIDFNAQDSAGLDSLTWIVTRMADTAYLYGHTPTYILSDSGCYTVLLIALTPSGCQSSSQQTICTDTATGNSFISSYPNPVVSMTNINLNLANENNIRISIFNSMGNQVQTSVVAGYKGQNHITLPVSNLPKGIYYVQIQYGNETRRSKIQKL